MQADQRFPGVVKRRVGQDDDEFLAAEAGQRILRPERFTDDGDQVDERTIAGFVPQGVIEFLEVVDIEQGDAKRRIPALCSGHFSFKCFFKAAPVERAGQLVVTHQRAGLVEFSLQFVDALVGLLDPLFGGAQVITRALGVDLDDPRFADDFSEDAFKLADVVGLADLLDTDFDLVVVVGRRIGKLGEVVDESGQHLFQRLLGVHQAAFELALLEDDLLEAMLGIMDRAQGHRARDNVADNGDLPVQPLIVDHQLSHIVDHELQQFEQAGTQIAAILDQKLQAVGQVLDGRQHLLHGVQRVGAAHGAGDGPRFGGQLRIVGQLRDHSHFQRVGKQLTQFGQQLAGPADGGTGRCRR